MAKKKKETTPVDDMKAAVEKAKNPEPITTMSSEQLLELLKATKVRDFNGMDKIEQFQKDNNLTKFDLAAVLTLLAVYVPDMRKMVFAKDCQITFGELMDYQERARLNFLIIHRVNYITHQSMIDVYDLLEKANKLRFTVKKNYLRAEEAYERYEEPRKKNTEKTAWFTMQDHLRISYDTVHPRIEKLYEAIRDYMIRLGWRDVEMKGRIEVALLMAKAAHHSFATFFKDFYNACKVDFSGVYANDRLTDMTKHFVAMSESLGIKVEKDKYGCFDVAGFDGEKNQRVQWAWDDFISDLRDDDLMDEAAQKAIELNPKAREEYKSALEDEERKQNAKNAEKLSEKFKVTKNK